MPHERLGPTDRKPRRKDADRVATTRLSLGLNGASGRMGLRLIQLIAEDPQTQLAARSSGPAIPVWARMPERWPESARWALTCVLWMN